MALMKINNMIGTNEDSFKNIDWSRPQSEGRK